MAFLLVIPGFIFGCLCAMVVVNVAWALHTTIPAGQRTDALVVWLRKPLRDIPERTIDVYHEPWKSWIADLIREWRDPTWACYALHNFLTSPAPNAVDTLEHELEIAAVEFRGNGFMPFDSELRAATRRRTEAEIERIFRRPPSAGSGHRPNGRPLAASAPEGQR